jgi:hypothetical protein
MHIILFSLAVIFIPYFLYAVLGSILISYFWRYFVALILVVIFIFVILVISIWEVESGFVIIMLIAIPIAAVTLVNNHDKKTAELELIKAQKRAKSLESNNVGKSSHFKRNKIKKSYSDMTIEELTIEFEPYSLFLSANYYDTNYEEYVKWYREMMRRESANSVSPLSKSSH